MSSECQGGNEHALKLDMVVSSQGCGSPLRSHHTPSSPVCPAPLNAGAAGEKVGSAGRLIPKPVQDAHAAGRAAAGPATCAAPFGARPCWLPELLFVSPRRFHPAVE